MTGFRYQGTAAAIYVAARFDYLFTGLPHMQALDDVIWSRGREALSLRTELASMCRRITADISYVTHSLERSATRADRVGPRGWNAVYQPSDRSNLVNTVQALNTRERELEELCRAAEVLGAMTPAGPLEGE